MLQIEYTAKRSLKAGHTVDTIYVINVEISKRDRMLKTEGSQQISLSGNTVTTVHRREETYNLQTVLVTDSTTPDVEDMLEFLDSTISGETFRLDLTGVLEDYVMTSITNSYRANRIGSTNIFQYSFQVRKL